jgi:signal transduction histidine kinase
MARRTPQANAGIEQWLERRYAQRGVRYLYDCWCLQIAWTLIVFALGAAGLTFFLDGSPEDFLRMLAIAETLVLVVGWAGFRLWARGGEPALAWLRGERSTESAPAAWETTLAAPVRAPLLSFVIAGPFVVASAFYAAYLYDTGLVSVLPIFAAIAIVAIAAAGSVCVFTAQLAVRPALRDISGYLPADFAFTPSRYGLGGQMIASLTVAGLTWISAGGAVAVITGDPVGRLALTVTLAPALLVAMGAWAFPLAAASLLGPVNDLIAATRRVADGDLEATVPIVTADELGELSRSFNEMTADLRRMTADLRESRARIVAASDASRRKVERDLHDGAQQDLVLLNLKLGLIEHKVKGDADLRALVGEARADLGRALEQLRDLAHGIYPAVLENDGLSAALADAARRSPIPAQVDCDGAGRYAPELEAAVYFCCLEALQNAAKHAGDGAHAAIRLEEGAGVLGFEVVDDGCGYDAARTGSNAGLQNMADRIRALGGELRIESAPGTGTTVSGRVPVA